MDRVAGGRCPKTTVHLSSEFLRFICEISGSPGKEAGYCGADEYEANEDSSMAGSLLERFRIAFYNVQNANAKLAAALITYVRAPVFAQRC